jgi:hypothetical protein
MAPSVLGVRLHSSKKTDGFRMVSDPNKYHGQTYPEKHGKIMKNL